MARKPVSVSQLNRYINKVMQTDPLLGSVTVAGEISNIKYHSSGHIYFTLKDNDSQIRCIMFASARAGLRYELADGMEIIAGGSVSVYEKGGTYSLNVRVVEMSGEGSLSIAFKALYAKLEKEGLFDRAHKKELPQFPKKICLITSPTGAAVRDMLKIIRSRNDVTDVLVYPCLVQGDSAAADIAQAIDHVNRRFDDIDTIIVGRGGGSKEDLWPFNEEIVARSIFNSDIPVISAVGHETDFSISDYVADRRAETPSSAAAMAVPDTGLLRIKLDDDMAKLSRGLRRSMELKQANISKLSERLDSSIRLRFESIAGKLENFRIMLEAGNPERIIARGYAVITDSSGRQVYTGISDIKEDEELLIRLKDGSVRAGVLEVKTSGR